MKLNLNFFLNGAALLAAAWLGSGCASHKDSSSQASKDPAAKPATTVSATATATVIVQPAKVALKFVKADSQETEGEDGKGENAVDGNTETFWHTQWQNESPQCPHEIVIELVPPSAIKGITYLPRQDGGVNGTIKDYEVYAGNDAENLGQPVAKGSFDEGQELKTVTFAPVTCRYIKLKAISEANGEAWTSAAEIGVVQ